MLDLSLIVPIYNEEANILPLVQRVRGVLDPLGVSYEFVFVDDGSTDASAHILRGLASDNPHIHFLRFSRNFGHQVALTAGFQHCRGSKICTLDADLQDPPELIPQMLEKLNEGFEVVYAQRRVRKGESWFKLFTAKLFYRIMKAITNVPIPLDTGDFRVMDRQVVNVLNQMPEQNKFIRGQIAWVGFRQTRILFDRDERAGGESGYTLRKMFSLALDGITAFSNFPLRVASYSGFVVSFIAFIGIVYTLISRFLLKDYTPGWASLMLAVLFIGGIQLIAIGVIGEYISRISQNVRSRPLYVLAESTLQPLSSVTAASPISQSEVLNDSQGQLH
jgi:dolichol-phosphate mannosyltransferase